MTRAARSSIQDVSPHVEHAQLSVASTRRRRLAQRRTTGIGFLFFGQNHHAAAAEHKAPRQKLGAERIGVDRGCAPCSICCRADHSRCAARSTTSPRDLPCTAPRPIAIETTAAGHACLMHSAARAMRTAKSAALSADCGVATSAPLARVCSETPNRAGCDPGEPGRPPPAPPSSAAPSLIPRHLAAQPDHAHQVLLVLRKLTAQSGCRTGQRRRHHLGRLRRQPTRSSRPNACPTPRIPKRSPASLAKMRMGAVIVDNMAEAVSGPYFGPLKVEQED